MSVDRAYKPLLRGIGFRGYRSFVEFQQVSFPGKVTAIAGVNNSGKSNILRFLQVALPALRSRAGRTWRATEWNLDTIDQPRGYAGECPLEVAIPVESGHFSEERLNQLRESPRSHSDSLDSFKEELIFRCGDSENLFWPRVRFGDQQADAMMVQAAEAEKRWPNWHNHLQRVIRYTGNTNAQNSVDVMRQLIASVPDYRVLPDVISISSARRVEGADGSDPDWSTGRGIVRALAALQNPTHGEWESALPRWHAINDFVRTVLDDPSASLNIPFDFSTIQVETPSRVLPLSSLGSGVEQVIVLASAATIASNALVCLEEPETNLHPLLQKKLIRYLATQTTNQYVVATHSPHILDSGRTTSHHVRLTRRGSEVRPARRPEELVRICNELGYSPSDLLQANCVIWVEGPADRIYIRHWLSLVDNTLEEGIDYEIMFYGGRLLAHLAVSQEVFSEFISLRRLNRWSSVVIDSDKTSSRSHLNKTKKRILNEFETDGSNTGFAWVTRCYTIENYLPETILRESVRAVHPKVSIKNYGQWDNPLEVGPSTSPINKVNVANECVRHLGRQHLSRYGLQGEVERLADMIRRANNLSTAPKE